MSVSKWCCCLLTIGSFVLTIFAQNIQDLKIENIIQDVIKAAENGNAEAQYHLGLCYSEGKGVERSYTEAVKWYRKAAEQGNDMAQRNLGQYYYHGIHVEQSYVAAVVWWRKAAEQGNVDAMEALARCYEKGLGVPQSIETATSWFQKAFDARKN